MRRGANDSNTAPMEIDALQQHGDKKCHTCGRFGHLAKDCWQNQSKSKGKDSKGKGGKKGKGKGKGKTDKDVCSKCGQRAIGLRTVLTLRRPFTDLTGRMMQTTAGGSGTMVKSGRHRRNRAQLRVSVPPTQPMAEPEAAMGGLWLASLTAGAESEQSRETSPAPEIMSLEVTQLSESRLELWCGFDCDLEGRGS